MRLINNFNKVINYNEKMAKRLGLANGDKANTKTVCQIEQSKDDKTLLTEIEHMCYYFITQ